MPGQMGNVKVSKKNLTIIDIRSEDNVMVVKGSVPGAKQGLVQLYTKQSTCLIFNSLANWG